MNGIVGGKVVALSGGVGGAKLADGLYRVLPDDHLTVIANTGDDFDHLGLWVSPDIDTVTYTLSELANPETGWGLEGETWRFMQALERIGGEIWFNLGDGDLAMHVERTRRLDDEERLTAITLDVTRRLGIAATILPMSDDPVPTIVETPSGEMLFQHYFVRDKCEPRVTGFAYDGADEASPPPEALSALSDTALGAIVICPSNPFISIDPILAVRDMREALTGAGVPIVAVSPIVGGKAIKGPTAKMMSELGIEQSSAAIAAHYAGLIDGLVIDPADAASAGAIEKAGVEPFVAPSIMRSFEDREALATAVLEFAGRLSGDA